MSILFIAVQCFNCSTMQVKQQKKSSNKWCCVICNEKQSVRKIYAQSFQAKDVRKFVQEVNSGRSNYESDFSGWIEPPSKNLVRSDGCYDFCDGSRKRMDWSEYLDGEDEIENGKRELDGEDGEVAVITEFPAEKFAYKPAARNQNVKPHFLRKRNSCCKHGSGAPMKSQKSSLQNAPSKWSNYLEEEEFEFKFVDDTNETELLNVNQSFIVADEVHPDFI